MTDFEPATDLPDRIDTDDTPVDSSARLRDLEVRRRRRWILRILVAAVAAGLLLAGYPWTRVLVAVLLGYGILTVGFAMIGSFARPIPQPPPPGELRRVRLTYRCPTCGTEMRMTLANDQIPQAPRHCADEMELTTPVEDR
ncbi:MAG: hypothetical protein ACK5PP_18335 [Acidimicrobiales bacterium]